MAEHRLAGIYVLLPRQPGTCGRVQQSAGYCLDQSRRKLPRLTTPHLHPHHTMTPHMRGIYHLRTPQTRPTFLTASTMCSSAPRGRRTAPLQRGAASATSTRCVIGAGAPHAHGRLQPAAGCCNGRGPMPPCAPADDAQACRLPCTARLTLPHPASPTHPKRIRPRAVTAMAWPSSGWWRPRALSKGRSDEAHCVHSMLRPYGSTSLMVRLFSGSHTTSW